MRWLRRAEITLFVIGFSLLGGAAASVLRSRDYQARQERAFLDLERKARPSADGLEPPAEPVSPGARAAGPDADPLVLGRLEIPRLGVSAIVREGDDEETLAIAVGHVPGTARPGERGNMALAGHRDSFFRALRHIRVDDTIRFRSPEHRYVYRVVSTEVVGPAETRVLAPSRKPALTLVTCYPFGFLGSAPDRFIVHAARLPRTAHPRRRQPGSANASDGAARYEPSFTETCRTLSLPVSSTTVTRLPTATSGATE